MRHGRRSGVVKAHLRDALLIEISRLHSTPHATCTECAIPLEMTKGWSPAEISRLHDALPAELGA
jgi:hypothetical protein